MKYLKIAMKMFINQYIQVYVKMMEKIYLPIFLWVIKDQKILVT